LTIIYIRYILISSNPAGCFLIREIYMGILGYFKGIAGEFHHITWPKRNTVITFTIITIIVSFAVAYFMGLFDWLFSLGLSEYVI